jgi:hypothetical protein
LPFYLYFAIIIIIHHEHMHTNHKIRYGTVTDDKMMRKRRIRVEINAGGTEGKNKKGNSDHDASRSAPVGEDDSGVDNSTGGTEGKNKKGTPQQCMGEDSDQGHRFGNFPNYYSFHPPENRVKLLDEQLDFVAEKWIHQEPPSVKRPRKENGPSTRRERPFIYCDIGCNEGDMTIEVSKAISARFNDEDGDLSIHVTGVDLDDTLIQRARQKNEASPKSCIHANFLQGDMCSPEQLETSIPNRVDLMSLFSTSMWLHIHAGDEGFREILKQLCGKTEKFFLIEPQPSKW